MKLRLAPLALGLSLAITASARIDLFLRDGGVTSFVFDGTPRNYLPYFNLGSAIPPGYLTESVSLDQVFFLWGRFADEPVGTKILGISPLVTLGPLPGGQLTIEVQENVIYRHAKTNGAFSQRWTRWDGPPFTGWQTAVTTDGVVNDPANPLDLVTSYAGTDQAAFLLGAFHVQFAGDPFGCDQAGTWPARAGPDPKRPHVLSGGQRERDTHPGCGCGPDSVLATPRTHDLSPGQLHHLRTRARSGVAPAGASRRPADPCTVTACRLPLAPPPFPEIAAYWPLRLAGCAQSAVPQLVTACHAVTSSSP
jgi:hypothetical protein